jgi:hypothetical protein
MNCSYRILKDVHIGVRVRKTKDKTTVPYKNEPITDAYIEDWNDQGFTLKHEAFTTTNNTIWLDFSQLPLNKLVIQMGFIKNPIVFVEQILSYGGSTSMVLLRADTFDYLELLEDHKYKVESEKLKPTQLKPGDQVISAICRESLPMIFLGRFRYATERQKYVYNRGRGTNYEFVVDDEAPEHAFFAYPQTDGGYNVESYPMTNKKIVELYRAEDKGKSFEENCFNDLEKNKNLLQSVLDDPMIKNYNDKSHIEGNSIRTIRLGGGHYYYYNTFLADGKLKKQQAIDEAKLYFERSEIKSKRRN